MRYLLLVSFVMVVLVAPVRAQVSEKEVGKLLEPWFEGSPYSASEQAARRELAGELSVRMGVLDEEGAEEWREVLLEMWGDGRQSPKKGGDRWYFEDEKPRRGRYILGGRTRKPAGLLVALHGGGLGSADAGPAAAWYGGPASEHKWLMIAPQALEATELGWTTAGTEEWVLDLVDQARRRFEIDASRVYFAGHSMGGYGSWTLGAHHADRVAALAPSAGAPTPYLSRETNEVEGIVEGIVPSLRNVPMVVFQSIDDPKVPPGPNQAAAREVEAAKARWGGYENFTYWETDGVGHGEPTGGVGAFIDRIADFERDPVPEKLVWQPDLDWKQQFYWLYWSAPVLGAIVVAERTPDSNTFSLSVTRANGQPLDGVEGLHVLVDGRIADLARPVRVELNGAVLFEGPVERRFGVLALTSQTGDPGLQFEAAAPPLPEPEPAESE